MQIESEMVFRLIRDQLESKAGRMRQMLLRNDLPGAQMELAQEMSLEQFERNFKETLLAMERVRQETDHKAQQRRDRNCGRTAQLKRHDGKPTMIPSDRMIAWPTGLV